jgi:fibronectin type 3 domain-containing protein
MSCRVVADLLPLPATVENLQVTVGAASITLTWDQNPQSNQVTGYNVYRSTSPNTGFTLLGLVTVTSYTDSTGVAATLYYYRVAAVNSAGEGPYASISVTFPGDVTAPAVPTNLTLVQNGPTNVAVDWDDNTEIDLAGYNIYASTAALGPFTKLNTTTLLPVSSYQHNAATPGNTWYYRVSAVDAALNESAFLTGNLAVVTPDVTAPAIPATPVASDIGSGISIDWVSNTEADLAGYNTYRSDDAFAAALNGITLLTASNYTDTTAVIGTPYSYKVDAKDTTGNTSSKSGASNTVTRTSPNTLDLTPYIKAGVMAPCPVHARGVSNAFLNPNYVSTGVVLINEGSDFPPLSNGSYEDARYDWNMAAGANQPKGSRSTMRAFNTAHVYDQAGTYTITLKRTDSAGVVQNWACDVNVAADSRVKCYVSANGDSSSLNSGTDITKPVSLTRAVALVAASGNIKVLLRRGDKFVTTGNVFSINKSNIWITSESTFAVAGQESVYPTITFSGVSGGRTFARVFANSLHCVVENLTFDQDYTDPSARSFDRIARVYGDANFVARNCNIIKCGHGVIMDDAGAARWILTQNLKALNDDSIAAYLVYGPCNDVVGLDLFSTNSILGHIVRHVNTCRALYAYCNCGQKTIIDPSSGQLEQLKTTFDFHHTLYVYVYKCTLPYPNASDGGQGQLQFGFANADTYNGTVCRYSVLELSVVGSQLFLPATCEHFVARKQ